MTKVEVGNIRKMILKAGVSQPTNSKDPCQKGVYGLHKDTYVGNTLTGGLKIFLVARKILPAGVEG